MTLLDLAAALDASRRSQGRPRGRGVHARTMALTMLASAGKRTQPVNVNLSAEAHAALLKRATLLDVFPAGLGAYLIETTLRADRCPAGHDLTADNARKEQDGTRRCRVCKRAYDLARRAHREARRKEARAQSRGTT